MAPAEPAAPAWLPDWADAATYQALAELTEPQWRWQWLRRHSSYRKLWASAVDESAVWSIVLDDRRDMHDDDPELRRTRLASRPSVVQTQDQGRVAELLAAAPHAEVLRALYVDGADRFGVRCVIDPALPAVPMLIEREFWTRTIEHESLEFQVMLGQDQPPTAEQWEAWRRRRRGGALMPARYKLDDDGTPIAVIPAESVASRPLVIEVIDLRRDIGRQLDAMRGWLELWQREIVPQAPVTRDRRDKWPIYLRVLDAREHRVPMAKIGKRLDLSEETARNYERAARKMLERLEQRAVPVG